MHEKNLKFLGVSLVDQRNNSNTYRMKKGKNFPYFSQNRDRQNRLNFSDPDGNPSSRNGEISTNICSAGLEVSALQFFVKCREIAACRATWPS